MESGAGGPQPGTSRRSTAARPGLHRCDGHSKQGGRSAMSTTTTVLLHRTFGVCTVTTLLFASCGRRARHHAGDAIFPTPAATNPAGQDLTTETATGRRAATIGRTTPLAAEAAASRFAPAAVIVPSDATPPTEDDAAIATTSTTTPPIPLVASVPSTAIRDAAHGDPGHRSAGRDQLRRRTHGHHDRAARRAGVCSRHDSRRSHGVLRRWRPDDRRRLSACLSAP